MKSCPPATARRHDGDITRTRAVSYWLRELGPRGGHSPTRGDHVGAQDAVPAVAPGGDRCSPGKDGEHYRSKRVGESENFSGDDYRELVTNSNYKYDYRPGAMGLTAKGCVLAVNARDPAEGKRGSLLG